MRLIRNLKAMKLIITALATILILLLMVCGAGCAKTETQSPELRILSHSMTVHEFTGGGPQSVAVVVGRVHNLSNMGVRVVVVTVNFYDKKRQLIATASTVKENLQAGEFWDFTVKTVGADAWKTVSYDIKAGTGQ